MIDQAQEYRCTIALPQAEVFSASEALSLLALAVRNRTNGGLFDGHQPRIFQWNFLAQHPNPDLLSAQTINAPNSGNSENLPQRIPKDTESPLIWDDKAKRVRASLSVELYQSARNGHLNLWSLFNDIVVKPPVDPSEIDFWTTTSNIFRSDLIKFCNSQKIRVIAEQNTNQAEAQQTSTSSHNTSSRPHHWADYEELALAFPDVGKTNATTLEWFKKRSSDCKRASGFNEALVHKGKQGRGNRSQFDIFAIAKYLLSSESLGRRSVLTGLRKHLGAAKEDYSAQYEALGFSISTDL